MVATARSLGALDTLQRSLDLVDVYMPEGASVLVALGSKATAGETILAEIGTPNTLLAFRVT